MRLIATMTVRNSGWCLGLTARAALLWCDAIIIRDHNSNDDTPEIATELGQQNPGRVLYKYDPDPVWNEMAHRQDALEMARRWDATHIAIVDDDEVLSGNLIHSAREWIERMGNGNILQVPWLALKGSIRNYYTSGPWGDNSVSLAFMDHPDCHWKARDGYDFHHRHPMGRVLIPHRPVRIPSMGGLMHLQFSSERRLRAKQALYKMTEVLRWPDREPITAVDQRYNLAVYGSPVFPARKHRAGESVADSIGDVPGEWWEPYNELLRYLAVTRVPWQEQQCIELMKEHGPMRFKGLDLFGVV